MSLFKNLFQSNDSTNEKPSINWIPLVDINQLDEVSQLSQEKPVLIFKHSTRCGISRMALKGFEKSYDIDDVTMDIYFLDLIQFRAVSNEIVSKFKVQHQSPQAIVISKGEVIYSDSHYGISVDDIKKAI